MTNFTFVQAGQATIVRDIVNPTRNQWEAAARWAAQKPAVRQVFFAGDVRSEDKIELSSLMDEIRSDDVMLPADIHALGILQAWFITCKMVLR